MLLKIDKLVAGYGNKRVLNGVSLNVEESKVTALFGHNGAGKSTTLNAIMGVIKPREGKILFEGLDITGNDPWLNARRGIGYCPEANPVFRSLTVAENLMLAGRTIKKELGKHRNCQEMIFELFPVLKQKISLPAGSLSGGERQMLALGMSLMIRPRLVLLDEPSAGLAPLLVARLFSVIQEMKDRLGAGVLLVEQNVEDASRIADSVYVLQQGKVVFAGTQREWLDYAGRAHVGDLRS